MTEETWLQSDSVLELLDCLYHRAPNRKLRLFGCALCRQSEACRLLGYPKLIKVVEDYVDERTTWDAVLLHASRTSGGRSGGFGFHSVRLSPSSQAGRMLKALADESAWEAAWGAYNNGQNLLEVRPTRLLRDIFDNPFRRRSLDPHVLTWNDGTVPRLASAIYNDRTLPEGTYDPDRLGVLADALDDAYCDDPELIAHCRDVGPHRRGCWAVDLLMGLR